MLKQLFTSVSVNSARIFTSTLRVSVRALVNNGGFILVGHICIERFALKGPLYVIPVG
jgi:hypothetical protein